MAAAQQDFVARHGEVDSLGRPPVLVTEPLAEFMDRHGIGTGPVGAAPIGDGHSNLNYLIRREGAEVVLRRPPRPPIPPGAHDVLREAATLRALEGRLKVPKVLAVCEEPDVIGAPFFLMEKVEGTVISDRVPPRFASVERRREIGEQLVDSLVAVHGVEWQTLGLRHGPPESYLERQVGRFGALWVQNRTRDLPAVERLGRWLADEMPRSGPPTLVHGDYRLGNVMFGAATPPRVEAIFDWELATIGDPLADLGYLTVLWARPDDPPSPWRGLLDFTGEPGFQTRQELVARYEQRGREMTDLRWYQALAVWKSAVIMEGSYKRAAEKAVDDPYLDQFDLGVPQLAEFGLEIVRGREIG